MKNKPDVGDQAPDFSLARDGGGTVGLDDFKGRQLVVFFYPRDNTPGCTKEAIGFSQLLADFNDANCDVVGISADSVKKHENFIAKHDLKVILGADPELETLKDFGVWVQKSMYGRKYMGIERTTFLIDANGKITRVWRKVKVTNHAQEVLEAVRRQN